MIVATSQDHYHAYWLVGGLAVGDFSAVQRDIAERFGGDPNVCDLPRVMRLPGFFHNKNPRNPSNISTRGATDHRDRRAATGWVRRTRAAPRQPLWKRVKLLGRFATRWAT